MDAMSETEFVKLKFCCRGKVVIWQQTLNLNEIKFCTTDLLLVLKIIVMVDLLVVVLKSYLLIQD